MNVCLVHCARFIIRTVLAVALTFTCLGSGIAQTQDSIAHEPTAAENDSAAEASKQAANPLASVWLMQTRQNHNWIGMPANKRTVGSFALTAPTGTPRRTRVSVHLPPLFKRRAGGRQGVQSPREQ